MGWDYDGVSGAEGVQAADFSKGFEAGGWLEFGAEGKREIPEFFCLFLLEFPNQFGSLGRHVDSLDYIHHIDGRISDF